MLKEVTIYFLSRNPRASEYEDEPIPHIDTISEVLVWETFETSFAEQDDTMADLRGEVITFLMLREIGSIKNCVS